MAQLLHILKKDCRYLRFEFLIYGLFLVWYLWDQTHPPTTLLIGGRLMLPETLRYLSVGGLILVAAYLIIRLMHAEAIPGDNQFWLTRPYSWKSLIGSKVLLLVVGVSLPMLLVRFMTFRLQGFPLYPGLWQLLWSQFVMTVAIALPIAALAALTSGLVQFVMSALILLPVAAFIEDAAFWARNWPAGTPWFREAIAAAGFITISIYVLHSQYKKRKTAFARGFAICAFAAVWILYFFTPWSVAMAVNEWLTDSMTDASSPNVVIGPQLKFFPSQHGDQVNAKLPVTVRGIPAGYAALPQDILVAFRGPNGTRRQWFYGMYWTSPEEFSYQTSGSVDRSFFEAAQGQPMTVRVSLDVILYPPSQSITFPVTGNFVNVANGMQCRGALLNPVGTEQPHREFDGLQCRSAFDWPEIRISPISQGPPWEAFPTVVPSHSPFYAGSLSLAHLSRKTYFYREIENFAVSIQGPPHWLHRDFEFRAVRFGDSMDIH